MKISKTNAVHIWKQIEDVLVPRLCLTLAERAVYLHLLRHSRLEDRLRLRFSILWLARGNRMSAGSVRLAVRRLVAKGALRLVERTKAGHVVEVRLPGEIRAVRPERGAGGPARLPRTTNLEEMDFLQTKARREAIHARERSVCFYCLRRLTARVRCLDHFVPQPGFRLRRMQLAERRNPGRGLSALALPRRAFDDQRIHWAAARGRSACGGQAPARTEQRGHKGRLTSLCGAAKIL